MHGTFAPSRIMFARVLHIVCSLWLAALLLFGTTPSSAIHRLARHHDTVHHHDGHGAVAEPQHHHCAFLGFELMPFDAPAVLPLCFESWQQPEHAWLIAPDERAAQQSIALREGRGPPAIF
jgi:hypothetical protein